jgi:hypothetical protein
MDYRSCMLISRRLERRYRAPTEQRGGSDRNKPISSLSTSDWPRVLLGLLAEPWEEVLFQLYAKTTNTSQRQLAVLLGKPPDRTILCQRLFGLGQRIPALDVRRWRVYMLSAQCVASLLHPHSSH